MENKVTQSARNLDHLVLIVGRQVHPADETLDLLHPTGVTGAPVPLDLVLVRQGRGGHGGGGGGGGDEPAVSVLAVLLAPGLQPEVVVVGAGGAVVGQAQVVLVVLGRGEEVDEAREPLQA